MGKKIIIAGGGHGGIAAGALLAKEGFDVTVYEKNKREDMGYDWTDIFDRKALFAIGLGMPPEDKYLLKNDMAFYNPSLTTVLKQHVPEEELEIQMERKEIYNMLISYAEENGVKFEYETPVKAPAMLGSRIVGVELEKGVEYADLVIDAAGINSPLRTQLPDYLGIQNEVKEFEQFYVYRGFFNKPAPSKDEKFRVFLFFDNKAQICWVADDGEYTDVLIGRFEPITMDDVNDTLIKLRDKNPDLGTELIRGGQFVNIPVRQPLGVMVADGYAAIGDSAFMTVPVIGSGIANCLKAAKILADTVIADKDGLYDAETLWKYQRGYYKKLGNGLAPVASIKLMLTRLTCPELDYIFENEILNADDMTIGADANNILAFVKDMADFDSLKKKFSGISKNSVVFKKVARMAGEIAKVTAATSSMPISYNRKLVCAWVKRYNACFKH